MSVNKSLSKKKMDEITLAELIFVELLIISGLKLTMYQTLIHLEFHLYHDYKSQAIADCRRYVEEKLLN
jgi:hypothetical protein